MFPPANREALQACYLVYPGLLCLLDGGVGVTIYTFQKDSDFPATFQQLNGNTVQSSAHTCSIQLLIILPDLVDHAVHLGAPVNNLDPEP